MLYNTALYPSHHIADGRSAPHAQCAENQVVSAALDRKSCQTILFIEKTSIKIIIDKRSEGFQFKPIINDRQAGFTGNLRQLRMIFTGKIF